MVWYFTNILALAFSKKNYYFQNFQDDLHTFMPVWWPWLNYKVPVVSERWILRLLDEFIATRLKGQWILKGGSFLIVFSSSRNLYISLKLWVMVTVIELYVDHLGYIRSSPRSQETENKNWTLCFVWMWIDWAFAGLVLKSFCFCCTVVFTVTQNKCKMLYTFISQCNIMYMVWFRALLSV